MLHIMITKEEEYMAEVSKIGGFALIAPFGKTMLNIPFIELFPIRISHLLYIATIMLLAVIGIIMIFSGKDIFSMYSPDSGYKVYEKDFWITDQWEPLEFGQDYDFTRPFFEQFDELLHKVPLKNLKIGRASCRERVCQYV